MMNLDKTILLPDGMDDIIEILESYGRLDRFYNDDRSEYLLHPYISGRYTVAGRMLVSKEEALMDLYDALVVEIHNEVQLIESKIPDST